MKTAKYYINLYKKTMDEIVSRWESNPHYDGTQATEEFENTANAAEVAGYYLFNEKENALKQWINNVRGIKLTEQDIEVTAILMDCVCDSPLNRLAKLIEESKLPIEVWQDDDGTYGIDVEGDLWSNYLSYEEAETEIQCLIKGAEIVK